MVRRWPMTATRQRRAPGVASREGAGSGMQVNQARPNECYTSQRKQSVCITRQMNALLSGAAKNLLGFKSMAERVIDLCQQRAVTEPSC